MKAVDYYKKYAQDLQEEWLAPVDAKPTLSLLISSLLQEALDLYHKRHGATVAALDSCLGEQNGKWNALIRIFKKNGIRSPLKEDGLMNYANIRLKEAFDKARENEND